MAPKTQGGFKVMWMGGVAIMVAAGALFWLSKRADRKARTMQSAKTTTVGELQNLIAEIREQLPAGASGYTDFVELKGLCKCPNPLTGTFSGEPGAIIQTRVERQVETREETRDQDGNLRTTWNKSTDTLQNHQEEAPFTLDDGSGEVRMLPENAELHLIERVDRHELPDAVEGAGASTLSLGNFSLSMGSFDTFDDRRTLGYRFYESALPVDQEIYVLGEAADTDDGLVIREPTDKNAGKPFIVSARSEAQLVASAQNSAKRLKIAGFVAIALGIGVLIYALMGG